MPDGVRGWTDDEEDVVEYLLRVGLAFGRQARELGLGSRGWPMDRIRRETNEFLRRLTIDASQKYVGEMHRNKFIGTLGKIEPALMKEFARSAGWQHLEDALLAIAEGPPAQLSQPNDPHPSPGGAPRSADLETGEKYPLIAEEATGDFLAELFDQFDQEEQAEIRAAEESTKEILARGDAAASDRQRAAGSRVAHDWVRQPQDDARVDAVGVVFYAYYYALQRKTDTTSAEGVDRFRANINKLRKRLGFWHTGSRSQLKMQADQNVMLARWLGKNGHDAERGEKLLQDAREWARAKLRKFAFEVRDVFELKDRVVSETWEKFVPNPGDFPYVKFMAALWQEGSPSLEDWAIEAILECAAFRHAEVSDGKRVETVAGVTGASDGSSEFAGRPKLPADAVQKTFDAEKTATEGLQKALDIYSPKNPDFVYQPAEFNAGCWKVIEHLTAFAAAIFDAQAREYLNHHPALVIGSDLLLAEVGREVVGRSKVHWTRWELDIDLACRVRWPLEYSRAVRKEANQPGSDDEKLTKHFLKRLDETISDRSRFWRESQDDAAFVAAYKENSAKSAELLAQQRRSDAAQTWPVLYRDLERTIMRVWRVRPEDITVNHVGHALDVLARNSDDGHVELDQQYCEGYGIDYAGLITMMRASLTKVSDLSSGPKVPRKSTEASLPLPNSVSLPPSTWSKVKAISAVLKTKSNQGEEKDLVICESLQRCFDVLVEDYVEQGSYLDFALLHQTIPDKVLESAVALEWLEPAWRPENIAWGYREWFMRLLEGRIEYFEACEFGRPFGHEHQKPDFVFKPMPESDDPVIRLLTNAIPPIETQPTGQVVYADQAKEPGRAVATVEVPASVLAARLEEATGQITESVPRASPGAEKKVPRKVQALSKRDHSIHEIVPLLSGKLRMVNPNFSSILAAALAIGRYQAGSSIARVDQD
jgi:hypothetical protein